MERKDKRNNFPTMNESLREKLNKLSHKPGVYRYYDQNGRLLYVGKAKDLFKRAHSYWSNKNQSPWTQLLIEEIFDIQIVEVASELEAFMLENSLIKSLKPKYNIQLKDDKTYPFLRISDDELPIFSIVRRVKNDRASYFGPYLSATYLRLLLSLAQELYGVRTAKKLSYEERSTLPPQIGMGARNLDNIATYMTNVKLAIELITKPQPTLEKTINQGMQQAAEAEDFERAAKLRDRLNAVTQLRYAQSLFGPDTKNIDYFGIATLANLISVSILVERNGKIVDTKNFLFEQNGSTSLDEISENCLSFIYTNGLTIPPEIIVAEIPTNRSELLKALREEVGHKVAINTISRGDKRHRLQTATDNADYQLRMETSKASRLDASIVELTKALGLSKSPRRIEAVDISNLGATNIVGATIVFIDGKPAKSEYRKYIVKNAGQDDFAAIREVVYRRLSNTKRDLPDLLIVDGGKGQLSAALDAMARVPKPVSICSLAKKEELIFLPDNSEPIRLASNSPALLLITAIRDEVHRFVISFHRLRRGKGSLSS